MDIYSILNRGAEATDIDLKTPKSEVIKLLLVGTNSNKAYFDLHGQS